jgi:hypothetical protein
MLLLNAFSLNMLNRFECTVNISPMSHEHVRTYASMLESAVGHADTAAVIGDLLGFPVECNRKSVMLDIGDDAIVAQYIGPRLPEGTTKLPADATIRFVYLTIGGRCPKCGTVQPGRCRNEGCQE